jgi:hypothetical protein
VSREPPNLPQGQRNQSESRSVYRAVSLEFLLEFFGISFENYPCNMYHVPFYSSAEIILKEIPKEFWKRNFNENTFSAIGCIFIQGFRSRFT